MEPSKRALNAEKRRADILRHAREVFAKEGFHRADVQVIADRAELGKGTVYRHFGTKEELFLAVGKFCVEELGEYIRIQLGEDRQVHEIVEQQGTAEVLRRIAIAFAQYYESHPQAVEVMIQERAEFRETVFPTHLMHRAETRAGLDELIAAASAAGQFRQYDAQAVTDTLADLLFGSVVNGCLAGNGTTLVARVSRAIDVFLHGLLTPPSPARRSSSAVPIHTAGDE